MEIILGAVTSLVTQWLKNKYGGGWQSMAILFCVTLVAASIYTALVSAGYWETVANVFITAGAFYAFVIQRFEK
jgi:hypothetical protein